tara:strand:- start:38 stop:520 length:483 start_codon:yes stop_codon:yes gene_type:complete
LEIYRIGNENKKRVWEIFRKYHYLNTSLHQAAEQWVGLINGELVCHIGIIQFPMRKGWKRVHRLVVLPNYQGIGIGTVFQDNIVQRYMDKFNVNCTTTTPALVNSLKKSLKWSLVRFSRVKNTLTKNLVKYYGQEKIRKDKGLGSSGNRITYSFNYKKEN